MTKVLIDGENLRHQIAHVLYVHKKIKDRNNYFKFDLRGFLEEFLNQKGLKIVYYTTSIKYPKQKIPAKLSKRISLISEANRRWIADLTNKNIVVIKAGHLRVRESSACVHCGKKTLVLQEKGVDVRIATDIVEAIRSTSQRNIILVSSDSDLLPAIEMINNKNLKINYLCYSGSINYAISSRVNKTTTFDDAQILKYHMRVLDV